MSQPIPAEFTERLDNLLAHLWMVRTFLKHCEEVEDDEELAEVHRQLYDYAHAVGIHLSEQQIGEAFRFAKKKLGRLKSATELFDEIQEDVSGHMNFKMANKSLKSITFQIQTLLDGYLQWKKSESN